MNTNIYTCDCGKKFPSHLSLNSHKILCEAYCKANGKDLASIKEKRSKSLSKALTAYYENQRLIKQQHQEELTLQWINEKHECETCGKIMTTKFGSGRFCCRSCANSKRHSMDTLTKISNSLSGLSLSVEEFQSTKENKQSAKTTHYCEHCEKYFSKYGYSRHLEECSKEHDFPIFVKLKHVTLNITKEELRDYREGHTTCEICGKSTKDTVKWDSKYAVKQLCVDHDHSTNKFRGLLCQSCNRQLGWFENNRNSILKYLDKDS